MVTGLVVSGAGFVGRCNIDGQRRKGAILEESGHSSNFVGLTYPFTTQAPPYLIGPIPRQGHKWDTAEPEFFGYKKCVDIDTLAIRGIL